MKSNAPKDKNQLFALTEQQNALDDEMLDHIADILAEVFISVYRYNDGLEIEKENKDESRYLREIFER